MSSAEHQHDNDCKPIIMRVAREMTEENWEAPSYDPVTQTSVTMGRDSSKSTRSTSTKKGILPYGPTDSDWGTDD